MPDLLTKPNQNPNQVDDPVKGNTPTERLKNAEERRSRLFAQVSERRDRMWEKAKAGDGVSDILAQPLEGDERDAFDKLSAAYGQAVADVEFYKGEVEAAVHVKEKEELFRKASSRQVLIEAQTVVGNALQKIAAGNYTNPTPKPWAEASEIEIPVNAINRDPETGRNKVEAYPAQFDAKGRRDVAAELRMAEMLDSGDRRILDAVKAEPGAMDKLNAAIYIDTTGVAASFPTMTGDISRYLIDISPIASYAMIEQTDYDNPISRSRRTAVPAMTWMGEHLQLDELDSTYGSYDLNSYKVGGISIASTEALRSIAPWSLMAQMVEDGVLGLGVAAGTRYWGGTGSSQVNGVVTASSAGGTWAYATPANFNFNLWVTFLTTANIPYQNRMRYVLCNKGGYGRLLGLVDVDGRPIFVDSLNPSMQLPGQVLGMPVLLEHNADNPDAASKTPFVIANLDLYHIRYIGGVRVDRSDEYKFRTDEVAFRFVMSTDGETRDANFAQNLATT